MANHLFGDLYIGSQQYKTCYVFITDFALRPDGAAFTMAITAYQDAEQQTELNTRNDMLLPFLREDETEESREIRALNYFQLTQAPTMSVVTGV